MAKFRLSEESVTPTPPPAGNILLYAKTDDVVYVQDSAGNEVPIGTPDAITDLTGDVTATGPGSVPATVNFVGGSTASAVNLATILANNATSANTSNQIVRRDVNGDFAARDITLRNIISSGTTQSTDKDTGAIVTEGGLGVEKNINAGGNINAVGNLSAANFSGSLSGTNTGDVTLTAVGSSPNANGASLSGQVLTLQPADGTNPGVITAIAQTIGGAKTFTSLLTIQANLDLSTNNIVNIGTANGVIIEAHASRHNPGGADALATGIAVTLLPDQANSAGVALSYSKSDHVHNIPSGPVVQIGTANSPGAAASFALSDHVHNHGAQTSPTLHALATSLAHGFMSSTDKAKIDAELPASLGTANQVLGVNSAGTAGEYKSLLGTTNQIVITDGVGSKTFSTPQNIHTGATPTFTGINLTDRLELTEQAAPSTPAANKIDVYAEDSNGFTRIRSIDDTGLTATILRDTIFLAKNTTGGTLTKGQVVYVNGSDSTLNVVTIALAKADSSNTVPAIGLVMESISNNAVGRVLSIGILSNFDTSAFTDGQRVYLSATTAGALTATKPVSPNIWQRIGVIIKSHATLGIIELRPLSTHGEESGTNTAFTLNTVALTDAATIATDASLGNTFTVTLGGNRTLGAPTNPTNGQKIVYKITQDGTGNRTLAFDAVFRFGLDLVSFTASTGAGKTDYIGCIYNSTAVKWDIVAFSKGF